MFINHKPKVATQKPPVPVAVDQGRRKVFEDSYRDDITPIDDYRKDEFKLLVHAYNPVMAKGFVEEAKKNGTYDPKKDINLLANPERLREKGLVSASVITAQHLPSFARLLFVLAFDPKDILLTSPKDGTVQSRDKEFLANPPGPTLTVDELVAKTKFDEHNEVLLRSENLKIQGLAVKHMVKPDGSIDSPEYAGELRALGKEKGLPVLELYQPCLLEDKIDIHWDKDGVIRGALVQHNGIGYSLSEGWQQRYFHPIQCDWEDISQSEYKEIRTILRSKLRGRKGGLDFLRTLDAKMQARFAVS